MVVFWGVLWQLAGRLGHVVYPGHVRVGARVRHPVPGHDRVDCHVFVWQPVLCEEGEQGGWWELLWGRCSSYQSRRVEAHLWRERSVEAWVCCGWAWVSIVWAFDAFFLSQVLEFMLYSWVDSNLVWAFHFDIFVTYVIYLSWRESCLNIWAISCHKFLNLCIMVEMDFLNIWCISLS